MNKVVEIIKAVYLCIGLMFFAKELISSNYDNCSEDLKKYGVSI
jgi:hypothetical protein